MSLIGFVDQSCRSKMDLHYKSLVFFHSLLLTAVINLMLCVHILHIFVAYFAHICVIMCLCVAVCGREFLSRVDILMQFYGVF